MCTRRRLSCQAGITLIEQIIFIVVVSVGVVGVLATMRPLLLSSADPQIRKQQLAIAESLLTEILHQPFTYCDPDDANAGIANSATNCAASGNDQNNGGNALTAIPSGAETRTGGSPGTQYDNVADYAGYAQNPVTNIATGMPITGYGASVAITRVGGSFTLADGTTQMPADAVLQIAVTVTATGADDLTLTGYRFRYAPRY